MNKEDRDSHEVGNSTNSDTVQLNGWAIPISTDGTKYLSELTLNKTNRKCLLKLVDDCVPITKNEKTAFLMIPVDATEEEQSKSINKNTITEEAKLSCREIMRMESSNLLENYTGLDYLSLVDELMVNQQVELFEVFTNWETKNRYIIKNNVGQQVYYTTEESDICARQCAGHQRSFIMHIFDNSGVEVARAIRELKLLPSICCCVTGCICSSVWKMNETSQGDIEKASSMSPTARRKNAKPKTCERIKDALVQTLIMEAPPGNCIGKVRQNPDFCKSEFDILDSSNTTVLRIQGQSSFCKTLCSELSREFYIVTNDEGRRVGSLKKHWAGFMREMFTDADNFSITFPLDLHKNIKATLLGSVFLIDFNYFENNRMHSY